MSDNESDFNLIPSEENFGGSSSDNLGGNLNEGPLDEDNSGPSNLGSQDSQPTTSKKRRRITPSPSRKINLRKRKRKINYHVGSPLKKSRKTKPVSIIHVFVLGWLSHMILNNFCI